MSKKNIGVLGCAIMMTFNAGYMGVKCWFILDLIKYM